MESNSIIPGTNIYTNKYYKIKSKEGTVLDSWGGKTGFGSASFQPDNDKSNMNRKFQIIHIKDNYYKIKSKENTVLDSWGGKTGFGSASFQPDNDKTANNRQFQFLSLSNGFYKIKSKENTVLDSWGGKIGFGSAAFQPDNDSGNMNRQFKFVLSDDYDFTSNVSDFNFGDKNMIQDILEKNKTIAFNSTEKIICKEIGIQVSNEYGECIEESFSWGFDQEIGFEASTTISCGIPMLGEAETTVSMSTSFGSNQNWSKSNTKSFKSIISYTPPKPGIYRIGKIVYKNTNVELPFTA